MATYMSAERREKLLADVYDPELAENHYEIVVAYFDEMKKAGQSPHPRDFEMLIKHQPILRDWLVLQQRRVQEELEEVEGICKTKEEDIRDLSLAIEDASEEIEGWETRKRDPQTNPLEDDALAIIRLFDLKPQLIPTVLTNDKIEQILEEGLRESKEAVSE